MHDIEKSINVLSAVICYKAKLGNDGQFHREGKIIVITRAINPLNEDAIKELDKLFLT